MDSFRRKLLTAWLASTYGSMILAFISALHFHQGAVNNMATIKDFFSSYRVMVMIVGAVTFTFGLIVSFMIESLTQNMYFRPVVTFLAYVVAVFLFSLILDSSGDRLKSLGCGLLVSVMSFFIEEALRKRRLRLQSVLFLTVVILPVVLLGIDLNIQL